MQVYFPKPAAPEIISDLQRAVDPSITVSSVLREVPDYEVLIEGRPTEAMFSVSTLKHVIVPFAGVPGPTLEWCRDHPTVSLHNLHHNAADTAETAVALLLACSRMIARADAFLRKGDWTPRYEPSRSLILRDKTALVLGYGSIGRLIAEACHGLGMKVLAVRRSPDTSSDQFADIFPASELPALLPRANAIVIALPQTAQTTGLIGEKELAALPDNAILVNIARGAIVDEHALYMALKIGRLHSAGLDVWYNYPVGDTGSAAVPSYFDMPQSALTTFPSQYPFHELDNVVLSPHRGGMSADTEARRVDHMATLLKAAAIGSAVPNRVDPQAGY